MVIPSWLYLLFINVFIVLHCLGSASVCLPMNVQLFRLPSDVGLFFFCFFFSFSTGLVRLYIAGLPLRSCRTFGAPSVQGSDQCAFFW